MFKKINLLGFSALLLFLFSPPGFTQNIDEPIVVGKILGVLFYDDSDPKFIGSEAVGSNDSILYYEIRGLDGVVNIYEARIKQFDNGNRFLWSLDHDGKSFELPYRIPIPEEIIYEDGAVIFHDPDLSLSVFLDDRLNLSPYLYFSTFFPEDTHPQFLFDIDHDGTMRRNDISILSDDSFYACVIHTKYLDENLTCEGEDKTLAFLVSTTGGANSAKIKEYTFRAARSLMTSDLGLGVRLKVIIRDEYGAIITESEWVTIN